MQKPMDEKKFIKKIYNVVCARRELTMESDIRDNNNCIWDSLSAVCYLDFIEEETGVYYDNIPKKWRAAHTVRDLYNFYVMNLEKGEA